MTLSRFAGKVPWALPRAWVCCRGEGAMSRKKRIIITAIALIVIALGGSIIARGFLGDKGKATEIAKEYLVQKYSQDMQCVDARYSWIDPALYHIYFSPVDNSDLVFEVMVQQDFSISEKTNEYGNFSADDYYISCFEWQMSTFFRDEINLIWDNEAEIFVNAPNPALYAFKIPAGLNDSMALHDMAPLIEEYLLIIDAKQLLDAENKADEANKMLRFIQDVQKSEYKPDRIVFWYSVPKSQTNSRGSENVSFENWSEITEVEQVALRIEEEFFSSLSKTDDAYYRQYFTDELGKKFYDDAVEIWGDGTAIAVKLRKESISEYKIANLEKNINIDDIEYRLHYGYTLDFSIPIHYDNDNEEQKNEEAGRILKIIQQIQSSGYAPDTISFIYYHPDSDKQQYVIFFANWGDVRWNKVESVESVIERLNGSWYDK